eukprot:m.131448 g.131448  ORF g.131448 m.131448 type:complete len:123 (+) comp15744_c4_seq1:1595-1963(+)
MSDFDNPSEKFSNHSKNMALPAPLQRRCTIHNALRSVLPRGRLRLHPRQRFLHPPQMLVSNARNLNVQKPQLETLLPQQILLLFQVLLLGNSMTRLISFFLNNGSHCTFWSLFVFVVVFSPP